MVYLAPRALRDSVRPRRLSEVVVRPLNFTVSCHGMRTDDLALTSFQTLRQEHFDRLCRNLSLSGETSRVGEGFAVVSAAAGNVRVFFEHDRGLCLFGLGAAADARPLCSVEEMAGRFPRARVLAEGLQRLSLSEQQRFVDEHWPDLQVMFSSEHMNETRAWHQAVVKETTARFSRGS